MDERIEPRDDREAVEAVRDRPVLVARATMRERLDDPLVRAVVTVVESRPSLAAQRQRSLEPIVLHVRVPDRPPIHEDVDELHAAERIPAA